jgi:hypothetical protein
MKALLLPLLSCWIALFPLALSGQIVAGPITNSATGHWYYLVGPAYWPDAEAQARNLGGHLASISDAQENTWIFNTFANYGGISRNLFIGFTDEGHEGQWGWTNGDPVTYVNWAPGEPNNGAGYFPYENVAMMYGAADGRAGLWNDLMGTLPEQQYWGVVEVTPTAAMTLRVSEVELCWYAGQGAAYQAQYRSSLTTNAYVNVGPLTRGSNAAVCVQDRVPDGEPKRFYRVVVVP